MAGYDAQTGVAPALRQALPNGRGGDGGRRQPRKDAKGNFRGLKCRHFFVQAAEDAAIARLQPDHLSAGNGMGDQQGVDCALWR